MTSEAMHPGTGSAGAGATGSAGSTGAAGQTSSGGSTGTGNAAGSTTGSSTGNAGSTGAAGSVAGNGGSAGNGGAAGSATGNAGATGSAGAGGSVTGKGGSTGNAGMGAAGSSAGAGGAGGKGTAGTTGGAGTTGAAGSSAGGFVGTIDLASSVLERGGSPQRVATWTQPALTKAMVMTKLAPDASFKATFNGGLQGVPLFVGSSMAGKGMFIAAATNGTVYALDETTGGQRWSHSIGTGGHGIISTPVIDGAAKLIYVASDVGGKHQVHALALNDGSEAAGWPVDVTALGGGVDWNTENQRGALSLVGKYVYVPYGGYFGDNGNYKGWVVAIDTTNPTSRAGWSTGGQQEGIWAAGGMASDGDGVFAVTGNNGSVPQTHDDSEEIIRVDGLAVAHHDAANMFFPSIWSSGMDNGDKDFGSCSPAVIMATGGTPAKMVVAPAKPGHLYLLDGANLGGNAGQVQDLTVAATNAESVYTAPTVYKSPSGLRIAITTTIAANCPGMALDSQIVGLKLSTANPIQATIDWCAPTNGDDNIRRRSPVSTTTDGTANPIVWFMNGSTLQAFDGETGAMLYSGGDCGGVERHTSPIVANGRVIVGGDGHLCSWSVQP
ncbi:MAG TPA: hypothetical protein VHL80_16115 [Polyangia bacterium]|nr:hypothetical protein [Polyangia bacterium]